MASEETNGTADEQPADDIRSALASALAEHRALASALAEHSDEPAEKPTKAAAKPEVDAQPADDAAADASADIEPKAADEAATADDAAKPDGDKDAEADKAAEKSAADTKAETELTGKWSAKDKDTFKKLPAEGRELLLRRHKEMEGAFTRKTQEIASFRKEFEPVAKLLEPWGERMKARGYTPQSLITAWANVEKRLMDGDGVGVVAGLINGYKIDLGKVAQALGIRPMQQPAQQQDGEAPPAPEAQQQMQLPPEITNQLRSLQERLDADDRAKAEDRRRAELSAVQKVESEMEAFKSAVDDKGQSLHPHFDELENDMLRLVLAARQAGQPDPSLAELYETAVWANPSTRKAQLAADQKAQQERAAQEARAKAAAAKKAASSVTGAPGSGQAPTGRRADKMSLREQLEAAAAEAEA